MQSQATGPFEVTLTPQVHADGVGDPAIGRMAIDKRFSGDLEAVSKGQMLAAMTDVEGSAGYVAIERVVGSLHGREGTFVLQHNGTLDRGKRHLSITVVPDSGTGALAGLSGRLEIEVDAAQHVYRFDYRLPDPA